MKVLQIITKGGVGGAQSHLQTLCHLLKNRHIQIEVAIGGSRQQPLAEKLEATGLPVHVLPTLDNSLRPLALWRTTQALLLLLRECRPDLLHAHSAMAGVVARLGGLLAGVPVVYTVHGFAFKAGNPWLRRATAWATEWILAPLTGQMICVSRHEAALARWLPLPRHRVQVVPNGLEDLPAAQTGQPRSAHQLSVVMVARMAAPKRPDLLLKALALIRSATGHEVPASFIGGGPDLVQHQNLAAALQLLNSVKFEGDVVDVPKRLQHHAIFVLLSDHEGLPISLIEAMRAGMPIVASDLPGVRELLPNSSYAMHVPPNTATVAAALLHLFVSAEARVRLGTAARLRYEQCFTAERMGDAVHAVYIAAMKKGGRKP